VVIVNDMSPYNQKKLKLSFNGKLIDKIEPSETRHYAVGFEPQDVTLKELEENIQLGFAFSYQFENGYRVSEGFLATDILVVDIDGGLKIHECLSRLISVAPRCFL